MLPVLIVLATALIGTGSVLLLKEKMDEAPLSEITVLNTNDNGDNLTQNEEELLAGEQELNDAPTEPSSYPNSDSPSSTNRNSNSSPPQTIENASSLVAENTNTNNYLTASDFKDLDKISYLSDTISNNELENSKISLVGESGDFVDNLHLGETLKIQGGEGIDTEVLNNEVVVSGEDASTDNKGIAKFDSSKFEVTSGKVDILDIYVRNTGDSIDGDLVLNGNFNANGNVVVRDDTTIHGSLTGNKGLSVSGGNINLNVSSNYPTNINTGTSTGNITLGSGLNTISLDSSDWDISTSGKLTGISGIDNDGYYTQTGTDANTFTGITTFSNPTYSALFTGGNVGIGTTAPQAMLQIGSNIVSNVPANTALYIEGPRSLRFGSSDGNPNYGSYFIPNYTLPNESSLTIGIRANGGSNYDRISISKNGIGMGGSESKGGTVLYVNPSIWSGTSVSVIRTGFSSTGSFTNGYGLYVENPTATITNKYAIVTEAGSGNVGIGTITPTALLHVVGTTLFQNSANAVNSYQFNNATGTSVMSVDTTNGRVGIGTTAPGGTLSISNNTSGYGFDALQVWAPNLWNNQSFNIRFGAASTQSVFIGYHYGPSDGGNYFSIDHYGDAAGLGLNIAKGGNVGIGVLRGGRTLEVLDSSNPQLRLSQTQSSFYTDLQTTSAGNLYINPSGGSVGIGTTSPAQKLDVYGGNIGIQDNYSIFFRAAANNAFIKFDSASETLRVSQYKDANPRYITLGGTDVGSSWNPQFILNTSSGNVGIGTTAPAYKLDVAGDLNVSDSSEIRIGGTQVLSKGAGSYPYNLFVGNGGGSLTRPAEAYQAYFNTGVGIGSLYGTTTGQMNTAVGYNSLYANNTGVINSAFGYNALALNTSGGYNVAIGASALAANTTGNENVAVGMNTLTANTLGYYNVAIGNQTLASFNVNGGYNTGVGYYALQANTGGSGNSSLGAYSLAGLTTGAQNTGIGYYSGYYNQTGNYNTLVGLSSGYGVSGNSYSNNTMIGYQTGYSTTTGGNNFFGGYQSGYSNTTGTYNSFVGQSSGYSNTTAGDNTALGINSSLYNQTGVSNVAIGAYALQGISGQSHSGNVAIGYSAGRGITIGGYNFFGGYNSGRSNTSGSSNVGLGTNTLWNNLTGSYNVGIGYDSLNGASGQSHSNNTAIGYQTGYSTTTGGSNFFGGYQAGYLNQTGTGIVAVGYQAGYSNTANSLVAIGYQAGYNNTLGHENYFSGYQAGYSNTTGFINTFSGYKAGYLNLSGSYNTALGNASLYSNTTGGSNTAIGFNTLYQNSTGSGNTAVGWDSLGDSISSSSNTGVGSESLRRNITGNSNTALGNGAIGWNTSGSSNIAVGVNSLHYGDGGDSNIIIGNSAGYFLTGDNNVFIGHQAGASSSVTSGTGNVFLGYQAGYSETGSNKLYVDNSNTASPLIYGDFSSDALTVNGTLNVTNNLTVTGNILPSANDTYSLGSDSMRWANAWLGAETIHVGTADADEGEIGYDTTNNVMTVQSNGNLALQASSGNVGIGTTSPTEKIDMAGNIQLTGNLLFNNDLFSNNIFIKPSVATTGNSARAVSFQANLNSASDTDGGAGIELYPDSTGVTNSGRVNIYAYGQGTGGNSNSIRFFTRSGVNTISERMRVASNGNIGIGTTDPGTAKLSVQGGGIVVGSPTGGDKGTGTINATAVYDDNVLLTDYVFDKYFDGTVRVSDVPLHADYSMLSLDQMADYISANRHLPTIPGRDEWERNGKFSLGVLANHLWETAETQALYVVELNNDIKDISSNWIINNGENEIEQLKARVAALENSNDNVSVANENVNENLNSNDNVAIDPAVVLPEAVKSVNNNENFNSNENGNSNDNLNIDQKINDQLSLLGIGDIGGTITAFFKEVWFEAKVTFEKAVVFAAEVTFGSKVSFEKPIELSADSVGQATVLADTNSVVIAFENSYEEPPVVTLTLASNTDLTKYYVSDVTTNSFTINIEPTQTADTLFNWHAFGKTKKADRETQTE